MKPGIAGIAVMAAVVLFADPSAIHAQRGRGGQAAAGRGARLSAPADLTGHWVSVVTEDWRYRMITPPKGEYGGVPLGPEGKKIADTWDPAKDEAAGQACKAYGAPAIMRRPGRLHITWVGDDTLRIDTDEGTQTRLLHFDTAPPANEHPSLQGWSRARWEPPLRGTAPPEPFSVGTQPRAGAEGRALEVTTSNLQPGYLRANGIPFSGEVELTEYFNTFREPNGTEWFVVTTIVRDPVYLAGPFVTTSNFKREPSGAKFRPVPCRAR